MKKILKLIVCLIVCISLSGCTLLKKQTIEEKLQEYVDNVKESVKEKSTESIEVSLNTKNKSIVYIYKYKETYKEEQIVIIKNTLEEKINASPESFKNLLTSVRESIPETESVIIEYYNGDDTLITTIEFK